MISKSARFAMAFFMSMCFPTLNAIVAANPHEVLPSTSTGTIRGIVKFQGVLPKSKSISMASDPVCARMHAGSVNVQEIITAGDGSLQNAVVFIADGIGDRNFEAPRQTAVIQQKGCMFEPHVVALQAGQPLEIVNGDSVTHNIHPLPTNNREWNMAELPGSKLEQSFAREEIAIPVKCNVHSWMRGYIAVFKHPYFAVTDKDGSFELSNLPPGTYTVEVWHEKLGTSTQKVSVVADETKDTKFVLKGMSAN